MLPPENRSEGRNGDRKDDRDGDRKDDRDGDRKDDRDGDRADDKALAPDALVGRIVGPYRVLRRLTRSLYSAQHLHLDREVALQVLPPPFGADPEAVERLIARARMVSRLRHRSLLAPVDLGESGDGFVHLALEAPEGPTLAAVIDERGATSWAHARRIGREVGAVLMAAQEAGVPVGDVGPEQVFVGAGAVADTVKVDVLAGSAASPPGAGAGVGEAPDAARALGRLLYLMVTGRAPVTPADGEAPIDPRTLRPDLEIPAAAESVIMRALGAEPSAKALDLAALVRELGESDQAAPPPVAPVTGARRTSRTTSRTSLLEAAFFDAAPPEGEADIDGAEADGDAASHSWRSFGRGLWSRPSRRALISAGAAGGVALVVLILVIAARPKRELAAPEQPIAAAPSPPPPPVASPPPLASPPQPVAGAAPALAPATPPAPGAVAARSAATVASLRRDAAIPIANGAAGAAGSPAAAEAETAAVAAALPAHEPCLVTLGSTPWSDVWIDGQRVGFTPLVEHPIACGPHEVMFTSGELGVAQRVSVVARPGQVLKKVVDLVAASPRATANLTATHAVRDCLVTLGSRPWSEISIDGRVVGHTPLVDHALACGRHEIIFRSAEANVERHESITVEPGQPLKKVVILVEEARAGF